ncbi:mitochondrial tRNA methylthiotransferase CDK5RAP1 isoform X6 [Chelonia mydas]|uniref:mitochondrial tRNA methylthiotransferase CDK5RAP1 isoform X6 n=1 Tax=Chelonia mydas TaxID=8469 RepID=UPI0018A1C0CE|nr:mitochondrial tRNA methylthiotransferase CDK5RAP1 isoform X6 [Chelonia mydas]
MLQPLRRALGAAGTFPGRPLSWAARSEGRARLSTRGPGERDGGLADFSARLAAGPTLQHFLRNASPAQETRHQPEEPEEPAPYLTSSILEEARRKVYLETYGCQMNVNDTEIAWAILQKSGYLRTHQLEEADVILLVTCSVREKAEQAIWNRLRHLTALKSKRLRSQAPLRIGILGCMAERLREEILHREKLVDIVAGPDAYRDLPRLLTVAESGQQAANVLLSLDETYADVLPVQTSPDATSAFVSIMRGCDNMCSYCIVPFTRGRERSRPVASILREVQMLSDQGVKEVTLLGQNVNSFRDTSEVQFRSAAAPGLSRGFSTIYKAKEGGLRFTHLLDQVSRVDPEMRIRFTSPHPKDFPDEVLQLIQERHNICKQLHLPAQSGSSRILEAMRRGSESQQRFHRWLLRRDRGRSPADAVLAQASPLQRGFPLCLQHEAENPGLSPAARRRAGRGEAKAAGGTHLRLPGGGHQGERGHGGPVAARAGGGDRCEDSVPALKS